MHDTLLWLAGFTAGFVIGAHVLLYLMNKWLDEEEDDQP